MESTTAQPAVSLAAALEHAERLLETDPRLAAEQARAILEVVPRHADTTRVLAAALRLSGDAESGLAAVAPLAAALPNMALAQLELALCLERLGRTAEAARAFDRASALEPRLSEAWRGLSESLELLGDHQGAERALARQLRASTRDPLLVEAATALSEDRLGEAERLLRDRLKADAGDVAALQIRLKPADDAAVRAAVAALAPVARRCGVAVLLNDRPDLAKETGCDGVHIGQQDATLGEARRIIGPDAMIGVTCHDDRELAWDAAEGGADYVAFGAFFPTATKDASHHAEPEILEWWSEMMEVPCVAIGGITPDNCGPLVRAGADFLAVVGAVWNHPDGPGAGVRAFTAAIAAATQG